MSSSLGIVSVRGTNVLGTGLQPRASGAAGDVAVTLDMVNERFRNAASALSDAFASLRRIITPVYATAVLSTQARPGSAGGRSARLLPVDTTRSVLQTTRAINTQTSTVQTSAGALGLDLSPGVASGLASSAALGLDVSSPETGSLLRSAAALGLDLGSPDAPSTLASALALALDVSSPEAASRLSSAVLGLDLTSPDAPSKLYSAIQLALDVTSPEAASRLSSAALGLDLTSPDAPSKLYSAVQLALDVSSPQTASALASSATLGLDVTSAQRASTIQSTAEINAAPTSYGSNTLTFSGGGAASTSVATLSGVYTGVNTAANATSLTVKLKNNVAALNTLVATNVHFEVRDQNNTLLFSFNANIKAGDQVSLGADVGLSISFSAGSLTNNQTAATTVSHSKTDVDPAATFNDADPNLRPRFENNAQVTAGSFTINGTSIAVNANDSINAVISRINASAAGVTAAFANDKITLTTTANSEDDIVLANDTSGLLSAVKLAAATTTRGNIRDDQQVLAKTSQFAAVASGSFTVNGVAISVNKNTDTLSSIISRINAAGAGVTAAYDSAQDKLKLTTTANSEDLITVGGDTSGFLTAAKLATANTVRGNIRDDQQVLAKTSQFASVASGSFTVNGATITVDRNTDTLATVLARITASAAGVTASYDSGLDRLVLTGKTNGEDPITVGADTSGFLTAAHLATGNTVRGHLREDGVVLADLSRFASVTNGSFVVDGKTIAVTTSDTIQSIVSKINASGARVTAAFDAGTNTLGLTTTYDTEDAIAIGSDTSGFLAAAGIDAANTTRGNLRDDGQVLAKTSQFATVASGSFTVNGAAITVDRNTDTLATVLARITASAAGVTASYDSGLDRLVLTGKANGEDPITVGADTSGFLTAVHLATANTVRGHLREDGVALADLSRFASVTNGSFVVDGKTIAVTTSDTIQSIVSRINASGARVTAAFDAGTNTLAFTTTYDTEDAIAIGSDTSGFLAAAGIDAANTTPGNLRDDQQVLAKTSQFASVASGSFTVNGAAITVDRNTDTLATVLARITASAAGVTASYDSGLDRLVLTGKTNGEDLIAVGNDTSGFLTAAHLATGNAARGHLREDGVALADLRPFQSVAAGSFVVDGKTVAVDPTRDTVQSLVDAINASGARVRASYDSATDTIALETTYASEDVVPVGGDTSGFLAAAHLDPGATVPGNVRDDRQVLAKTSQFGAVGAGTFTVNGKTIAVDAATDTLASIVDAINAAGAGVTAAYDRAIDRLQLVGTSASEDPIAIGADTSGFLAAARLDAANTVRGNVPDDVQVLAKTSQFGTVASGSFAIDDVTIAVDPSSDTLQTIVGKINASGAGVTASYDPGTDRVVLAPDVAGASLALGSDSSGFLSAAKLAPGAFGTHVAPDAAFDGTGLAAPFFDPGLAVGAGSFTVNGVRVDVTANDTVRTVLARITASAAGVSAAYDAGTQTITLTATRSTDDPIVVADDSSGFLAAVKLDGTAASTSGAAPTSSFAAPLDAMPEYATVHAGTVTVNGHDVAIDPASTTVAGFVTALNRIDGVEATLNESTGAIRVSAKRPGAALAVSDTSGLLGVLGIASRTYRGTPGVSTTLQTQTGTVTSTNAASVADDVSAAIGAANDALALLGASGATPAARHAAEATLRDAANSLAALGVSGVGWGGSGLVVDRQRLATSLGAVLGSQSALGTATRAAVDQLATRIAAAATSASSAAAASTSQASAPAPTPNATIAAGRTARLVHALVAAPPSLPRTVVASGATSLLRSLLSDAARSGSHGLGAAAFSAANFASATPSASSTSLRRWRA